MSMDHLLGLDNFTINTNLIDNFDLNDNESCSNFMILIYFSKLLFNKWQENTDLNIKYLIHKKNWDADLIRSEKFLETSRYRVEFELRDLRFFLNLSNSTINREKFITLLNNFMDFKLIFWENNSIYRQHVVYSLSFKRSQGVLTTASIVLHPYTVHELLKHYLFFNKEYINDYYSLLDGHKINRNKKGYTFIYRAFFAIFLFLSTHDKSYLVNFFLTRNKTNLAASNKQIKFFNDFIALTSEHLKTYLGARLNDEEHFPVNYLVLKSILNKKTDKVLNKTEFFFQSRQPKELMDSIKHKYPKETFFLMIQVFKPHFT